MLFWGFEVDNKWREQISRLAHACHSFPAANRSERFINLRRLLKVMRLGHRMYMRSRRYYLLKCLKGRGLPTEKPK